MRPQRHPYLTGIAGVTAGLVLAGCGGGSLGEDTEAPAPAATGDGAEAPADTAPITIGLLVPTSGVFAPLGEDMTQGFQLYLDENDGMLGGKPVTVQAVDEGGGPDTGIPAAQGLVQDDVDAVVGIVNSAIALGVADLFNEAQIPLVVANAGANDITGAAASDYVFRTAFANGEVAAAIGPYVAEQCESAFLIAADYAAGQESAGGFRESFTAAGGTIAGEVFPPFGTTDNYQPFLSQIQASGADCAYSFFAGSEAVAFTQQYSDFGLKDAVQLYSAGFLTEGGVLTASGEAATGIETSLHYSDQLDSPTNTAFVEAYTAAYGEAPTVYAVQAYDAAQVLDEAFAGGSDGPSVVAALDAITTVDSPRGEWTFSEGNGPEQPYYLRRVEMADGVLVNTIVEELPAS